MNFEISKMVLGIILILRKLYNTNLQMTDTVDSTVIYIASSKLKCLPKTVLTD